MGSLLVIRTVLSVCANVILRFCKRQRIGGNIVIQILLLKITNVFNISQSSYLPRDYEYCRIFLWVLVDLSKKKLATFSIHHITNCSPKK